MPSVRTSVAAESSPLHQLLDEAGAAPRVRPVPARRTELDHLLRAELRRLIPRVEEQAVGIDRGTRDWYGRDKALDDARDALTTGLSPSSLAACIKLSELARSVRVLDAYARSTRFCARCDRPILAGQEVELHDVFGNSGPGAIVEVHGTCHVGPGPLRAARNPGRSSA
jgi:hypothetical protein